MSQLNYQQTYRHHPPNEVDWKASNSAALALKLPYAGGVLPWPSPAPVRRDLSATTGPEEEESDDTLLQQVLIQFSTELDSPMPEEVVARIEEENPEVLALYDLATYEFEYAEGNDEDSP